MVEVNLTLGLVDQAKKDAAVLGYNFPGDPWYGEAYKLMTARGLRPQTPPRTRRSGLFGRAPRAAG